MNPTRMLGRVAMIAATAATIAGRGDAQHVSRAAARADLDSLGAVIRAYSAYRLVNRYPVQRHLDSVRAAMPDSMAIIEFHRIVQTLVGRLQDAHSVVRLPAGVSGVVAPGELPFALSSIGDSVIALAPCRCSLLLPDHPRLISINGVAIDSLMRIAGIRFAGHSPQRFRYRALGALTPIEDILTRAGAADRGNLRVRLSGTKGDTTLRFPTVPRRMSPPPSGTVAVSTSGPVAIVRIPLMLDRSSAEYAPLRDALQSAAFRSSAAYIIDVRGNDGGTRHALEDLAPYFISAPLVYNIAVARADTAGIRDRGLLRVSDATHPEPVRSALRATLGSFKPRWDYTVDSFLSERFAAVLTPVEARRSLAGRPVVVLMDEGCFSATDIFLGAMRLIPNITLMGLPSGGGSGRSRDYVLRNSRLTVTLSTMASFQVDGQMYDGIGITPTVVVPRTVEGLATGQDTQMAAALKFLQDRIRER